MNTQNVQADHTMKRLWHYTVSGKTFTAIYPEPVGYAYALDQGVGRFGDRLEGVE